MTNKEAYKSGYTNGYQELLDKIVLSLIEEERLFKLRLNKDQRSGVRLQKAAIEKVITKALNK